MDPTRTAVTVHQGSTSAAAVEYNWAAVSANYYSILTWCVPLALARFSLSYRHCS